MSTNRAKPCYGQIIWETGDMRNPYPDDYQTWDSIGEAKEALADCFEHPYLDDSQGVTLLLWIGTPDPDCSFPCDGIPDRVYALGPRGGVQNCLQ